MDTGDLAAAAGNLSRALELHEGLGHAHGRANALVVLGAVRQRSGDYDAASASLHLALDLYLEVGNQWGEANALIQLGVVQLATGDHEAAETGLHHALRICRKLGSLIAPRSITRLNVSMNPSSCSIERLPASELRRSRIS